MLRPPPDEVASFGLASTAEVLVGLGEGFLSRIEFDRIFSDECEGKSRRIDDDWSAESIESSVVLPIPAPFDEPVRSNDSSRSSPSLSTSLHLTPPDFPAAVPFWFDDRPLVWA